MTGAAVPLVAGAGGGCAGRSVRFGCVRPCRAVVGAEVVVLVKCGGACRGACVRRGGRGGERLFEKVPPRRILGVLRKDWRHPPPPPTKVLR